VIGGDSSGEVECIVYALDDGLWLGLGSDHTDRKAEAISVTLSKQMCGKPVSALLWRFADVAPHWERLVLRSFVTRAGKRRLYQEGPVTTMRRPEELIRLYTGGGTLPPGTAMFCGTLAVQGGIEGGDLFEMELEDPVLGRKLTHSYRIEQLPVEG
jgi:2-keto-4-pentenoate hydratase/2-oxohepta-3-ene-1,7-dioic acid hydratase in catechol pathway